MAMKAQMLRGELYRFDDLEIQAAHARGQAILERYNATGARVRSAIRRT